MPVSMWIFTRALIPPPPNPLCEWKLFISISHYVNFDFPCMQQDKIINMKVEVPLRQVFRAWSKAPFGDVCCVLFILHKWKWNEAETTKKEKAAMNIYYVWRSYYKSLILFRAMPAMSSSHLRKCLFRSLTQACCYLQIYWLCESIELPFRHLYIDSRLRCVEGKTNDFLVHYPLSLRLIFVANDSSIWGGMRKKSGLEGWAYSRNSYALMAAL